MGQQVVAIVGRPNVGKSTLFNRLVERRQAIEDRVAGVTRDRVYGKVEWSGQEFTVIDTGGLTFLEGSLDQQVQKQVQLAVEEADLIVFVVDAVEGDNPLDLEVASYLRRQEKKVILVANKIDPGKEIWDVYSFFKLGMGEPLPVSATHGLGVGDLLDKIKEDLPAVEREESLEGVIRVALAGRPNAGKSMLVNQMARQERSIVNEMPGTTRDNVDVQLKFNEKNLMLVDTAGIRKKSKVKAPVEYYSVIRSLRAVERSDVVLMLIDATEEITEQDKRIAGYIYDAGKAIILTVNKWDLLKGKSPDPEAFKRKIRQDLSFLTFAPVVFVSALTGLRVNRLPGKIIEVEQEYRKRIDTAVLNDLLQDAMLVNPPPSHKGQRVKFYYATQPETSPPGFVFFVNNPDLVHFSYVRYLENRLREAFGFTGVPVRIKLKPSD